MRLSFLKAGSTCRKSSSPQTTWVENDGAQPQHRLLPFAVAQVGRAAKQIRVKQFLFFRQPTRTKLPQRAGASVAGPVQAGTVHRRLGLLHISLFFLCWVMLICGRLVWLQVIHYKDFVDRAARQQQRTFEVAPRRGILYDRNLHELAMTVLADSVYAVPSEIADRQDPEGQAKRQAVANALAKVVHTDPTDRFTSAHQIAARLNASRNFAWIARKLEPAEITRVKALNLKGVYFQKEFKRFYPNTQLAAQVLGYVGTDDNGLGGMERKYDRDLHGVPGRMLTALDARRHVLDSQEREPDPGQNLVLTIDENIQFMAERALDSALERTHALNGTVVVQDPYTGQILALAIRPTFNPNDFRHATTSLLKNHAVSDVYEPGSTFKLVTYSAALEQKVTNPEQLIDCQGGKIELAGRIIHDSHANGVLTVAQALAESSDVAAVKLALRMGPTTFTKYIHDYGFGLRSDIELPAETRGLLAPIRRWSGSSIGSIAIGQEVGVTPIQLATMVSTIANGGVYLPPHILMQETSQGAAKLRPAAFHPQGELPDPLPAGAHRVISTMTAAQMRKMMEGVVLFGTAKGDATLNGYTSAGKTGTAQKIDVATHRYSKTKYIASFVGIAPVNNPAISVAVIIDSPEGNHFGNINAGPVFREVAQEVLEYLGVPHDTNLTEQKDLAKSHAGPELDETPSDLPGDLDALFAEVNNLPPDDPLRSKGNEQPVPSAANELPSVAEQAQAAPPSPPSPRPAPNFEPRKETADLSFASAVAATEPRASGHGVVVNAENRIGVPSFLGEPLRVAVESAGTVGLSLQIVGSGIAREQVPAPGSMVPPGTEVVVRFTR
jgi:cell division protein FtsI (penicillin-binding protein 3)